MMAKTQQEIPLEFMATLEAEHRLIVAVLGAFEAFLSRAATHPEIDHHELTRFLLFFVEFAEGWHHAKEEAILLPIMTRHGYANTSGVLRHVRDQHQRERSLLSRLKRVTAEKRRWDVEQTRSVIEAGQEFVSFEAHHIEKESELLYPAIRRDLEPRDAKDIAVDLFRFGHAHATQGDLSWLERLGAELVSDHPPTDS